MSAADNLIDEYGRADAGMTPWSLTELRQHLAAVRAEAREAALREAYAAIENPEERRAVGGGLGWETARDVVHNLIRKTEGGAS
ncbi:hypothetical protein [Streptomyces sp. PvR018]|uniref:hypothetical protein n=1 Tax=Streptomyces sp. PvR018 TaxID=3156442 RepID=UPI0033969C64